MKKNHFSILALVVLVSGFFACKPVSKPYIGAAEITKTVKALQQKYSDSPLLSTIEKGVSQVASAWQESDGTPEEFTQFCLANFEGDPAKHSLLFKTLSKNFEILFGYYNKIGVELKLPLHVVGEDITPIDEVFGGLNPFSHFSEDMFANKVAFICLLNFPAYNLQEKNELGENWTREQWAYARMGEIFSARIPASLSQKKAQVETESDTYIASYNICMEKLTKDGKSGFFADNTHLITHWGLRDELKSQYANVDGFDKQQMIYQVMKRIIDQDIPQIVINNPKVSWDPYTNVVVEDGKEIKAEPEPNTRYAYLLKAFKVAQEIDAYSPLYPTHIDRVFNKDMELGKEHIEKLFTTLMSSEQIKQTAAFISQRLGRDLEAYDIWYQGLKSGSDLNEADLDAITKKKFPTTEAFQAYLPTIMTNLGFTPQKANYICDKIKVDASRGAGHAWGAEMKGDKARLRSRIGADGMNYKGYNIGVHEFGHNVEQTISLYDVDYYMLKGVPTTAFTEALAFMFQMRDISLLGVKSGSTSDMADLEVLQTLWSTYEIMGVSLVDIRVWEWLYANENATEVELKQAVIRIAKEVWNEYYAPVFGKKDEPILAIYSHMIVSPLYLPSYPIGHLIDFQLEQAVGNRNFADAITPWFEQGRLTPKWWMINAVGEELSVEPILKAAGEALGSVK